MFMVRSNGGQNHIVYYVCNRKERLLPINFLMQEVYLMSNKLRKLAGCVALDLS